MVLPINRLRRLRILDGMRELARETVLSSGDLICPMFVDENADAKIPIPSMPGIERIPLKDISDEAGKIYDAGIPAIMLFGIPAKKDDSAGSAYSENGIVQRAASEIRSNFANETIMADVCLCQYTTSGHCGLIKNNYVDNDSSLSVLAKTAVSQAQAGVNVVSPSAMMDGQVFAIRSALDEAGFENTSIMSHSAKHRSNFYSPFRDAAECAPQFGDRKTYQVPYTNKRESVREVREDIREGVDIVMIKPALAYLDLIAEARQKFDLPVSAYSVSGEYSMVMAAANSGFLPREQVIHEVLCSIKRAGADMIVTYFAMQAAEILRNTK